MKISAIPRRIVTGLKNGRSLIVEDKKVTNVSEHLPGLLISDIWTTNSMPVDLTREVTVDNTLVPDPPKQGSYFRYVSIPPDKDLGIPEMIANEAHPLMH